MKNIESKIASQSLETINLSSGRGITYDRNNLPLTIIKKAKYCLSQKKGYNEW